MLGPEAHLFQWQAPNKKCRESTLQWRNIHAGFFLNILAANVYILPLFSYKAQLAQLDDSVTKCLEFMKSQFFIGPGNWIPPKLMENLSHFGFRTQLHCMHSTALASKIRVALNTKVNLNLLYTDVGLLLQRYIDCNTQEHPHWQWHTNIFVVNLHHARKQFYDMGGSIPDTLDEKGARQRRGIQKKITASLQMLRPSHLPALHEALRNRLTRFKIGVLEGYLAPRAIRRLQHLAAHAAPAVTAVYLRTLLNGWATHRRMRSMQDLNLEACCPFCRRAEDSIEHFAHCTLIREQYAASGYPCNSLEVFLVLDINSFPDFTVARAKLLAAVYTARNSIIHAPDSLNPIEILKFCIKQLRPNTLHE